MWLTRWLFGPSKRDISLTPAPIEDGEGNAAVTTTDRTPPEPSDTETPQSWWAPPGASMVVPQPPEEPLLSTEARALEHTLAMQCDGRDLGLPPLPRVPERVLQRLRDRDCDFSRLAADIAEDPVVAAAVVRTANSPLYRGLETISALPQAVNRLGANAIRTLMLHQSLRAMTFGGRNCDRTLSNIVWRRALASAAVMRWLSAFVDVDDEEAFLIGLLHDIGHIVVLREAGKQQSVLQYELDYPSFEYLCYKFHQGFGLLIAEQWQLPENLHGLIGDHHRQPTEAEAQRTRRLMLHATDMICSLLGYTTPHAYDLLASSAIESLALADDEPFRRALPDLPSAVEDTLGYF